MNPLTPQQVTQAKSQLSGGTSVQSGLLSPQQVQQAKAQLTQKTSPTTSWDAFDKATKPQIPQINPVKQASQNITTQQLKGEVSGLGSDLSKRASNISDVFSTGINKGSIMSPKEALVGGAKIASEATGGIADVFSRGFSALTDIISNSPELQKFSNTKIGNAISDTTKGAGEQVGVITQPAKDALTSWAQQHPDVASLITSIGKTGLNLSMIEGGTAAKGITGDLASQSTKLAERGVTEVGNIASDVKTLAGNKISSMLPEAKPQTIPKLDEAKVLDNYNRSIKPSVAGKKTAQQISDYNSKVVTGVKSIVENKSGLEFTDDVGNVIKGETPKTVDQMSQAISQTKKSIYDKYDALATQAGEKGIRVNARNIAMNLDPVIKSKSLAISNPEAVKYAKSLQERLWTNGEIDAKTAQEVIQNYNSELKAYYRNPTPGLASNVQIDAMIANKMRTMLDDGITNATGEQYQTLKNQYGALSSIEKDVANRAQIYARQSKVGLASNLSNIASGAELVRGLITMNPADIAASLTIKGVQKYIQYLNNPDVGIQKMFNELDKSYPTPKQINKLPIENKIASPQPTTFIPKSQTGKMIQEAKKSGTQGGFARVPFTGKSFNDFSEVDKAGLRAYANDIKNGKGALPKNTTIIKNAFKKYGLNVPENPKQIASQIELMIKGASNSDDLSFMESIGKNKI